MYNRYIPQPDGSYRRSRMHEPQPPKPAPASPPPPPSEPCPPEQPPCPPPKPPRSYKKPQPPKQETPTGNFLRQLLPKDFDTGDLIIVLLLLLMAGDCEEDRNNAILTLALYFMM